MFSMPFYHGHDSSPQPFWYQGPISWKTIFPQTRDGVVMVLGSYKCITFIVHFISIVITLIPPQFIEHSILGLGTLNQAQNRGHGRIHRVSVLNSVVTLPTKGADGYPSLKAECDAR